MKYNVLSLFDGISCGRIALEKAGIEINKYYSSEINSYANKISKKNWPEIERIGDVKSVDISKYPKIDIIIAGSPCQGFSRAGQQLNFEDQRSKLFFEFVRILRDVKKTNPNVLFLLENVVMKIEYQEIITEILGVEPILINSNTLSPQYRERLYWTNIKGVCVPICIKKQKIKDIIQDLNFTHNCPNALISISSNGIENIKKGTSGYSWFFEQQVYTQNSFSRALKAGGGSGNIPKVLSCDNKMFRKLTPLECERLQTLPDNYTDGVSNNQRYILIGNGWTVDVISHILKSLNHD